MPLEVQCQSLIMHRLIGAVEVGGACSLPTQQAARYKLICQASSLSRLSLILFSTKNINCAYESVARFAIQKNQNQIE